MNKYFINITKNLNLKAPIINTTDDIQSLTKNYENHISIRKIKEAYPEITRQFPFYISPAGNYMFKVNNRNTRTRCEICSKLTIKTPERR